ncbi:hypothetical protein IG631_07497 [Alternaria alternata]|nr:hypothetical protein IG631_07497 [Alternaria alternata]
MEHLLAGVGLGGILSTLAGAKEVCPYPDHPHHWTNSLIDCHHRLPGRSHPRYPPSQRRQERPRAVEAQCDRPRPSMGLYKHPL